MDTIEMKLDAARQELLDLSLRNKLLNYRPLRSKGAEIVDELAEEVFRIMVTDSQAMSFLAAPEEEEVKDEDNGAGSSSSTTEEVILAQPEESENGVAGRHLDNQLQTSYSSSKLQKRLLNTFYAARTYIEEQGVNVLYLALGMLHWYESESSDVMRQAPLVLIPVELYRTNVQTRFRLRYTDQDIGENLSLRAKLKADFGIELPEFPNGEDMDLRAYFEQVEKEIEHQPRWSVARSAIVLSFFSFGTFLMYNDLDVQNWPDDKLPIEHPLLQSLLQEGFDEPAPTVEDDDHLDQHVSPKDSFQVVDADSSQTLAILDVNQGRNLVIQGPPGTGKSQTITNLIAEALAQNKTVLFVAEKMAALEVVKQRLDEVGLGAACLEVHSHKTSKKIFLEELQHTLELGKPQNRDYSADMRALVENRDRLNDYSEAVNTPVGMSGMTPFQAYGHLLQLGETLQGADLPAIDLSMMQTWSGATFRHWLERVDELQTLVGRMGVPVHHPFWGSGHTAFLPADRRAIQAACAKASRAISNLQKKAQQLAEYVSFPVPKKREDAIRLSQAGQIILLAPDLNGIRVLDQAWLQQRSAIKQGVVLGSKLAALREKFDRWLLPEAWDQNVLEMRGAYANYGDKWWRFLSGSFRRARQSLHGLCRVGLPDNLGEQKALIDAILEAQRLQNEFARHEPLLASLFSDRLHRNGTDWEGLAQITDWLIRLYEQVQTSVVQPQVVRYLDASPDIKHLRGLVEQVEEALDAQAAVSEELLQVLQLNEVVRLGQDQRFVGQSFINQQHMLRGWYTKTDRLQEIVSFTHLTAQFADAGLQTLVALASEWPEASQLLSPLFLRTWHEMILSQAVVERSILSVFDGETHEQHIRNFCQADELLFHINRTELALKHWQQLPRHSAGGQLGILQREFAKKRRHLPIRRLMARAGFAIQTIKPVFMMSPLSVAMFLPPGSLEFDLIVFDEASQVRPVESFGAILRGKQSVVVGDSRQLPPTAFFNQILEVEEDEESPTADLESVLSLFTAQGAPQRMLRWHYRSRHESLIAVSNYEFYDNRLVIFPSPDAHKEEVGLVFHHLPQTAYDRGHSRTNAEEARIVAEAVMDHASKRPHLTLGVAAFSISQMQAIQDQLELLRRMDPSRESFFNSHTAEPFFVKNLENVQGDERDVIFISVGYGRSADGYFTMNFGPLNKDGGERRLNVLITRARLRCEIFTNLTDEDIDLNRTNARGVVALKRYLKYARTDNLDIPLSTEGDADSLFEELVADGLRQSGYNVVHQVGSAGFYIDLAIVDNERPGRYLLGIECDGATYHSARTARDRDRLRQQVLEGMGWRIHRIWSTDWFRNPERELRRAVQAIENAQSAKKKDMDTVEPKSFNVEAPSVSTSIRPIERHQHSTQRKTIEAADYQVAQLQLPPVDNLHEVSRRQLASWIRQVVEAEGPVHFDEVARRIIDAVGVKRVGSRIRQALEWAIVYDVRKGRLIWKGDFLWMAGMDKPTVVRSHANLPDYSRTIEQIAPQEIMLAVETVVKSSLGMPREEIPSAVCSLLGFGRTSEAMRQHVDSLVEEMINVGELSTQGNFLVAS